MNALLDICEELLEGKCIRYRDAIICRNNQIKIVDVGDPDMTRVCVNFYYLNLPKRIKEKAIKLDRLERIPQIEITLMNSEAETIGVWLALAALGQEPIRPDDLLVWPSGDYAWTKLAAAAGHPERRFG